MAENENNPIEFLTMNDDCLHAILNYLDVVALNAIASTNFRLQNLACKVFALKERYNFVHIGRLMTQFSTHLNDLNVIKLFFKNFGAFIKSIHFADSKWHRNEDIFDDVIATCNSGMLRRLEITNMNITAQNIITIQPVLIHITCIKLTGCGGNWSQLLAASKKCTELLIRSPKQCELNSLKFEMPNLVSLIFDINEKLYSDQMYEQTAAELLDLDDFIRRHQHLTKLNVTLSAYKKLLALGRLTNLKELKIVGRQLLCTERKHLGNLRSIETLLLGLKNAAVILTKLNCLNTLKDLSITNCTFSIYFAHVLNQFYNLHTLRIKSGTINFGKIIDILNLPFLTQLFVSESMYVKQKDLIKIVQTFEKLEELNLCQSKIVFNKYICERIIGICRRQNRKLTIILYSNCYQSMIGLNSVSNWLKIVYKQGLMYRHSFD